MKNKEKKAKFAWKKIWSFRSSDWDSPLGHSCLLFIFANEAITHRSVAAIILIALCAVVFILRDLAVIYKWWLYTDPANPKYIKSFMLYMAIELIFTLLIGLFGKLWSAPFLLFMFIVWMFVIIPEAVKTLKATYFVIKRWSRFWPRTL